MTRLLVTGASGYLGRRILRWAAPSWALLAASHRHPERCEAGEAVALDLTGPGEAERRILELAPSAIIHTAAVNPGGPDELMEAVNVSGTAAVARAAARLGCRLVHVSSDVVHDGRGAPYADDAPPHPLWLYGRTKARGEAAVRDLCPQAVMVRTSLIYSLDEMDRVTAGFARRWRQGKPLQLFTDQLRQPIWAETLAKGLLELVELPFAGFLNVAGEEVYSRDEIALRLLKFWGVKEGEVRRVRSADLGIDRPRDLRLDLRLAREVLATPLPGLVEVLAKSVEI